MVWTMCLMNTNNLFEPSWTWTKEYGLLMGLLIMAQCCAFKNALFIGYVHLNLLTNLIFTFHKKVLYYSVFHLVYSVHMWALACVCILGDMANSSGCACKTKCVLWKCPWCGYVCVFVMTSQKQIYKCAWIELCVKICIYVSLCIYVLSILCESVCLCVFAYNLRGREYTLQVHIGT